MSISELYDQIISRFLALDGAASLLDDPVTVTPCEEPEHTLRPKNDPASTVAKPEYAVTAKIRGIRGEAYTEHPCAFQGTLRKALETLPTDKGISAVTVSALNAAMSYLSLSPGEAEKTPQASSAYADALCRYVAEHYGRNRIVLVGYDGYIVKRFVEEGMDFWTMDRNPDHISQDRFHHVIVNSGKRNRESCFAWGKLIIVTGSTLCNGTICQYLDSGKELLFYGITCAGAATLLQWPWFSTEKMTVCGNRQ